MGGATAVSDHDHSWKTNKKPKSREVSSRFLSPASTNNESPNIQTPSSPLNQKPRSSADSRKHKSFENSGFLRGLWPASSSVPSPSSKPDSTLADHLGNDRLKDMQALNRQRSCTEFSRFDQNDHDKNKKIYKENHKPAIFGGSMRYTGKYFKFPAGKSSRFSNPVGDRNDVIAPGRLSVDENALRGKSLFAGRGLSDTDDTQDSGSEYSDMCSGGTSFETPAAGRDFSAASYMAPTVSSRKHGIEVPSKFMQGNLSSSRSRRWSADSGLLHQKPVPSDNYNNSSPKIFSSKKGNGNWAHSPADSKGRMIDLTNSKPPSSPSRGKGVGGIISMGIELFKGKKSSSGSSLLGPGTGENVHQLRLLHNRLIQWRYTNARAEVVNGNAIKIAESNSLSVWHGIIKLHSSVLEKKLQLQKEKLEMKLNYILHSQIKELDMWGNMERQHLSAVSSTIYYLHSVVCRIPLIDGAKVEPQSASLAVRHASDLAASINLMLITFSQKIEKTVGVLAELAMVVTQEKLLLEECFELFSNISVLEIQERSLKGSIMQLRLLQQQHNYQQQSISA